MGGVVLLLPSQQGPSGGGGADSCALSADVNCLDGGHRAKRANEKMSDEEADRRAWPSRRVEPPTSQPVLCGKENTGQVNHNTHTPVIQSALCIHTVL